MRLAADILHIASSLLIVFLSARVVKNALFGLLAGLAFVLKYQRVVLCGWRLVLSPFRLCRAPRVHLLDPGKYGIGGRECGGIAG